ncbi:MAG: GNAT family N-acetyltransferase [Myxococcota bacterium]|jgi:ribosomal protein S18 acetylase RimI-like enzyme|nr:GNAT family N-acetyltransferase [Myxococcota bacterium]
MAHTIRPATHDDIPMLAEVILLATRSHVEIGVFDLMVPESDAKCLAAIRAILASEQPSWCHYSNFIVACMDGEPAAALSGYAAYDPGHLPYIETFITGMKTVGYDETAISEAFKRIAIFTTVMRDDEPDVWIVEFVACLPAYRRRGLTRDLMEVILEQGVERGHTLSQIAVLIGNVSAQRLYEQAGFEVTFELANPELETIVGSPGIARMLRPPAVASEE